MPLHACGTALRGASWNAENAVHASAASALLCRHACLGALPIMLLPRLFKMQARRMSHQHASCYACLLVCVTCSLYTQAALHLQSQDSAHVLKALYLDAVRLVSNLSVRRVFMNTSATLPHGCTSPSSWHTQRANQLKRSTCWLQLARCTNAVRQAPSYFAEAIGRTCNYTAFAKQLARPQRGPLASLPALSAIAQVLPGRQRCM